MNISVHNTQVQELHACVLLRIRHAGINMCFKHVHVHCPSLHLFYSALNLLQLWPLSMAYNHRTHF